MAKADKPWDSGFFADIYANQTSGKVPAEYLAPVNNRGCPPFSSRAIELGPDMIELEGEGTERAVVDLIRKNAMVRPSQLRRTFGNLHNTCGAPISPPWFEGNARFRFCLRLAASFSIWSGISLDWRQVDQTEQIGKLFR